MTNHGIGDDNPTADMEMSSKEAVAYLGGPAGHALSAKFRRELRYIGLGPVVRSAVAAPFTASQRWMRSSASSVRTRRCGCMTSGRRLPTVCVAWLPPPGSLGYDQIIETLDKQGPPDVWDPDQAKLRACLRSWPGNSFANTGHQCAWQCRTIFEYRILMTPWCVRVDTGTGPAWAGEE